MKKEHEQLIGALIGIARAVDGNEHLITPSATVLIRECLCNIYHDTAVSEQFMERIQSEKRMIVPDCFECANPCGRTSSCDLSKLPDDAVREMKYNLIDHLCMYAEYIEEEMLYRCLVAVGIEDYQTEDVLPLLQQVKNNRIK